MIQLRKMTMNYHPYDGDLALLTQKDAHNIFSGHKFITGPQEWSWSTWVWKSLGLGILGEFLNFILWPVLNYFTFFIVSKYPFLAVSKAGAGKLWPSGQIRLPPVFFS